MSAQLHEDDGPDRVLIPRTIKSVRAALPEDQRGQFMAELEDVNAGGLLQVLETWWARAAVWSSPRAMASLAAVDNGTARMIPIEEALPELRRAS
jgi:hypothetical protein